MYKLTDLHRIETSSGYVQKFFDKNRPEFIAFGEVYFSCLKTNLARPPKVHLKMTMNIIVISGSVQFEFFPCDDRSSSIVLLQHEIPQLLTVPPGIKFSFRKVSSDQAMICNVSDIIHDEGEIIRA